MRVAFLLGSGISVDAGMPGVAAISSEVFGGSGVVRHSDATYYIAGEEVANYAYYRAAAEPAIEFTGRLRHLADGYFNDLLDGRSTNYEDVANLAKQVADALSGEYENPALMPLLVDLLEQAAGPAEVLERASEARGYIRDIVWRLLNRPIDGVEHLRAIVDACRALGAVDLFELNHDRVLEKALADARLAVSDGFTRGSGDVFYWTDRFDQPVRHFKLHGSITWFHRQMPGEPWRGLVVARSTTDDPYHERGAAGELLEFPAGGRPVLLTGTFDKPLAYDSTVYSDQHFRFQGSLRETDALVGIGYGFRDKAINSRLLSWLHSAPDKRLVIAHGDIASLVAGARPAIALKWNGLIRDGRLHAVEKWVADLTWHDLSAALGARVTGGSR